MFRLFNKLWGTSKNFLAALVFTSCGFANLAEINVSTYPDIENTVLSTERTPVYISFDTEMKKQETEKLITIQSSSSGNVECDTHWEGNKLIFTPAAGWTKGIQYVFECTGMAAAADKREIYLSRYVPFYAVTNDVQPYIKSWTPSNGASVGVTKETGAVLHLIFSKAMDKVSVQDNLTIDGIAKKVFEWNTACTELFVSSAEVLSAWTQIRWALGTNACSENGIPIVTEQSGTFITDSDIKLPKVKSVFPMIKSESEGGYKWLAISSDMEIGLGADNAIGIEFTKPLDAKSINNSVRFEPSLSGSIDLISSDTIIFVPSGFPNIDTLYRMTVSKDIKDTFGLKLESEHSLSFYADIPYLKIVNIFMGGDGDTILNEAQIYDGASADMIVDNSDKNIMIIIEFSISIESPQKKIDFVRNITLEPFFPSSLGPTALTEVEWASNRHLMLVFNGLDNARDKSLYKLYFPGGSSGLSNGKGSYLKDSVSIYLEAK
ncbi:MAG: hypothetical protein Ta2G_04340 [Termitinemataceae bacterium]|nr:MAG: hypothetical protein Ta2G_04340 [Termitinemataceae bacterium]